MVHRALSRLDDMLAAANVIDELVAREIQLDHIEMLALERVLEIISEASRHVPDDLKADFPDTPWRQIAGLGNILRHDYPRVDPKVVLDIARRHVPGLQPTLRAMIERLEREDRDLGAGR